MAAISRFRSVRAVLFVQTVDRRCHQEQLQVTYQKECRHRAPECRCGELAEIGEDKTFLPTSGDIGEELRRRGVDQVMQKARIIVGLNYGAWSYRG